MLHSQIHSIFCSVGRKLPEGKGWLCFHLESIYSAPATCLEFGFLAPHTGHGPNVMLKNIVSGVHGGPAHLACYRLHDAPVPQAAAVV